jgi:hypothetical protein
MKWLIDALFGSKWEVRPIERKPLVFTDDERMLFSLLPQGEQMKYAQAYFTKPEYIISAPFNVYMDEYEFARAIDPTKPIIYETGKGAC